MIYPVHIQLHHELGVKRINNAVKDAVTAFKYEFAWRYYNNKVKRFKRLKLI